MTSRTGRTNNPARRGFTLLELIVVMLLMAVIAAMVAPSLGGFSSGRALSNAAARIVAMCNYAASQSAAEGRAYRLNLDPVHGACWLTVQESGFFRPLNQSIGRPLVGEPGVRFEWVGPPEIAQRGYVQFQPSGEKDAAALRVVGDRGNPIEIRCDAPLQKFRIVTPENG